MRSPWLASGFVAGLAFLAAPASAVTFERVLVGDPGNERANESHCLESDCGSVPYSFYISKYEVTNTQYAECLDAKAADDPLDLYDTNRGSVASAGITRSGSPGGYAYQVKPGFGGRPVDIVSFFDALRSPIRVRPVRREPSTRAAGLSGLVCLATLAGLHGTARRHSIAQVTRWRQLLL